MNHIPVLKTEAIESLNITDNAVYIDATLGGGGYTNEILWKLKSGVVISIDIDAKAIDEYVSEKSYIKEKNFLKKNYDDVTHFIANDNFANIQKVVDMLKLNNEYKIMGIVADLGLNSDQLDNVDGFSFQNVNQELDMRLDKNLNVKAIDILRASNRKQLASLFEKYSDLKSSFRLADIIKKDLENISDYKVGDLARSVDKAFGSLAKKFKLHAKVFQTLRIVVNSEFDNLEKLIKSSKKLLDNDGRLVIISFHSGEDRVVKHTADNEGFKPLNDVIISAKDDELLINQRARSAKLRAYIKNNK